LCSHRQDEPRHIKLNRGSLASLTSVLFQKHLPAGDFVSCKSKAEERILSL